MSTAKEITPVASTALVTISSEETAKVALGETLVKQMEAACDKCRAIEIVDDASLQVGRQLLKALNQQIKSIDDQRTKIKEPYLRAGQMIDGYAKKLTGPALKVVEEGKKKISDYEILAKEKADELIAKAEVDAENTMKAAQEKADETSRLATEIAEYETNAVAAFTAATTMDELKAAHEKFIKPGFPEPEHWGDQQAGAKAMFKRIVDFKDLRKAAIAQQAKLTEGGRELTALEKRKLALEAEMAQLAADEKAEQERIAAEQAAAEEKRKADEIALMREQSVLHTSTPNVGNMRESISWELHDWDKVPEAWKQLNEDAIKLHLKEHKGKIANGVIINGVRFIVDRKPVL